MRIAVFSDTHGRTELLENAVRRTSPDILVHLGDHIRDSRVLSAAFPDIPLYAVPGNCDFASREQDTLEFFAGPVKVFATHGHRYYVKSHTHIAHIDYPAGMTVVNPGSSGLGAEPSFAQIDISDGGGVAARILPMLPRDRYM